jgi:NADP-dependent 3-hydroxy acid dehydrogenase YdfG
MARAHETFGKLDILFVNAGIYKGAPVLATWDIRPPKERPG